jgi:arylsulfatase A-like enzyme
MGFVERHRDRPFFLYLAYNAPHTPLQVTPKYLGRFNGIADEKRRTYAAMVSALDDGIGRVLAKLAELKLDERTLVWFMSDNGGPVGSTVRTTAPFAAPRARCSRAASACRWRCGGRVSCRWEQFTTSP